MNHNSISNRFNIKNLLFILYAILSTGGIAYYLAGSSDNFVCNKLIYLIVFFLYYQVWKKGEFTLKKNGVVCFVSAITSIILVIGNQLDSTSDIAWNRWTLYRIIALVFALIPVFKKMIDFFDNVKEDTSKWTINKKMYLKIWGILFLFGLLGFLALYPGMYGYDAAYQIMQVQYTDVKITTHFSILYCYILSGFVNFGNSVFNSNMIGFAMYSFFQMCILTYITARVCIFSYKVSGKKVVLAISTIFFCIFPLHILMMVSSAQDALFCGIMVLVMINSYEMISDTDGFFKKKFRIVKYILLILLFCMMKNNGIYIIMVPTILTMFFEKKHKIKTLSVYVIAISLFLIYKGPVLSGIGVIKGNTTMEMLSVPSQQIARSHVYNSEIYSDDEEALLDEIFSNSEGDPFKDYLYRPSISDPVKGTLNEKFVNENKRDTLCLYVKKLFADPENFTEAFLMNSLGFWYPEKVYEDSRIYHPYIEFEMIDAKKHDSRYIEIERNSILPGYHTILEDIISDGKWKNVPIVSSLFTCGTYFILLLISTVYSLCRKKYSAVYMFGMLWGYYLTLLLSPVCIFRYCYAMVLAAPLMVAFLFHKGEIVSKEK